VGTIGGGWLSALGVYDDGNGPALYAGGNFGTMSGTAANSIARWDGLGWSALGGGLRNADVRALAVFDDGSGPALYVGMERGSGTARGTGWSWATPGGCGPVAAMTVYDDGRGPALYAAGSLLHDTEGRHIGRWDGVRWSPLGSGVDGEIAALAVYDDGRGPAL